MGHRSGPASRLRRAVRISSALVSRSVPPGCRQLPLELAVALGLDLDEIEPLLR
jgi:hypothetical protein